MVFTRRLVTGAASLTDAWCRLLACHIVHPTVCAKQQKEVPSNGSGLFACGVTRIMKRVQLMQLVQLGSIADDRHPLFEKRRAQMGFAGS